MADHNGPLPDVDLFDEYFRRVDLDQDDSVSKVEALAFFVGSNLPRYMVDKILRCYCSNREGVLGRKAFYDALKLISLAQGPHERGEELFLGLPKELYLGPDSAPNNIPAPKIDILVSEQQLNSWATIPIPTPSGSRTYVFPNGREKETIVTPTYTPSEYRVEMLYHRGYPARSSSAAAPTASSISGPGLETAPSVSPPQNQLSTPKPLFQDKAV